MRQDHVRGSEGPDEPPVAALRDGEDILFLLPVSAGQNLPTEAYGKAEAVGCYALHASFPAGGALELTDCTENAVDVRERGKGRTAV